jgi:hypothetical protein
MSVGVSSGWSLWWYSHMDACRVAAGPPGAACVPPTASVLDAHRAWKTAALLVVLSSCAWVCSLPGLCLWLGMTPVRRYRSAFRRRLKRARRARGPCPWRVAPPWKEKRLICFAACDLVGGESGGLLAFFERGVSRAGLLHGRFPGGGRGMVVAYVRFVANNADQHARRSRVHAMLLPKADDESDWGEIARRDSPLHGVGVFPSSTQHSVWDNVHEVPVALPYFGYESACEDKLSHRCLVDVLKGEFETLVVHDLQRLHNCEYVADELFAVPQNGKMAGAEALPADTPLLQIEEGREPGVRPSAQVDMARTRDAIAQLSWVRAAHGRYYLLADRVSDMLQVTFEPGKSAATHLAEVYHIRRRATSWSMATRSSPTRSPSARASTSRRRMFATTCASSTNTRSWSKLEIQNSICSASCRAQRRLPLGTSTSRRKATLKTNGAS